MAGQGHYMSNQRSRSGFWQSMGARSRVMTVAAVAGVVLATAHGWWPRGAVSLWVVGLSVVLGKALGSFVLSNDGHGFRTGLRERSVRGQYIPFDAALVLAVASYGLLALMDLLLLTDWFASWLVGLAQGLAKSGGWALFWLVTLTVAMPVALAAIFYKEAGASRTRRR